MGVEDAELQLGRMCCNARVLSSTSAYTQAGEAAG